MKIRISLIISALCFLRAGAQSVAPEVISAEGGYYQNSSGSIAFTIGESVSETYNNSNITTMGFHQPELGLATLIKSYDFSAQILVFPNPVCEVLKIDFTGMPLDVYTLMLYDEIGKLLYRGSANLGGENTGFEIKVAEFAQGVYLLDVKSKTLSKTVKINKVN